MIDGRGTVFEASVISIIVLISLLTLTGIAALPVFAAADLMVSSAWIGIADSIFNTLAALVVISGVAAATIAV